MCDITEGLHSVLLMSRGLVYSYLCILEISISHPSSNGGLTLYTVAILYLYVGIMSQTIVKNMTGKGVAEAPSSLKSESFRDTDSESLK